MNKFPTNLSQALIQLSPTDPARYRGSWTCVHYNTVIDSFHLGEFSSAIYQITVEYDSNEKEIMQLSVIARPDRAVANIFGRSSINQELVNLSVTVDQSQVKINASPTSNTYAGAKLIFHATYAKTIHQLTPPAIVAETSSVESDGINTFDATTTYFDNTNITFDKV